VAFTEIFAPARTRNLGIKWYIIARALIVFYSVAMQAVEVKVEFGRGHTAQPKDIYRILDFEDGKFACHA
jgi:hypothetical protein